MKNTEESIINQLSPYLFWDIDKATLDMDTHRAYIIKRVLEYGQLEDWHAILAYYTQPVIIEVIKNVRELDPRALAYIATITNTPIHQFKCYTTRQSNPTHWNF